MHLHASCLITALQCVMKFKQALIYLPGTLQAVCSSELEMRPLCSSATKVRLLGATGFGGLLFADVPELEIPVHGDLG